MSLTGALLAVLVQQWAQSYLRATQQRQSQQDRVKTREFCARGLKKSNVSFIVRTVPTLIHVSLLLFFVGLLIWLVNINGVVYLPVVSWLGLCGVGYAYATLMPVLHHDSPYQSPLSSLIRRCKNIMQFLFSQLSEVCPRPSSPFFQWLPITQGTIRDQYRTQLSVSMHEARLETARALPLDVNYDAFKWTFESLKRDGELERFYDAIPDLCASPGDPLQKFIHPNREKLSTGLVGLMDRTFSSDLVAESVKQQRIKICMKAAGATNEALLGHWYFLRRVLRGEWASFLGSVPFGRFVQNWQNSADTTMNLCIRCVVSAIIARAPAHDETWTQLVRDHLPVTYHPGDSGSTPQDQLVRKHSLLLANLNCIVSYIARFDPQSVSQQAYDFVVESLGVLESICNLDVQRALPSLQHEFCRLWNQLVQKQAIQNAANPPTRDLTMIILNQICDVHVALHGSIGALTHVGVSTVSYAECIRDGHRTVQTAATSPINSTTSGPAGNANSSTVSILQPHRLPITAHPSSSTLGSTLGIAQVLTHVTAAVPITAPDIHATAQQSSTNPRDASQTPQSLPGIGILQGQAPQPPSVPLPVQVNPFISTNGLFSLDL